MPAGANLRAAYVRAAFDASLGRLAVDRVDVYQVHGPDRSTPLEEVVEFVARAVAAGKATWVGPATSPAGRFAELALLCQRAGLPLVAHQPQYGPVGTRGGVGGHAAAIDAGLGVLVWGRPAPAS